MLAFMLYKASASYDAFDADFDSNNAASISAISAYNNNPNTNGGNSALSHAVTNTTITCQAGPTAAVVVPGHYAIVTKTRSITCTAKPTSFAASSVSSVLVSSRCQCGCKRSLEEAKARKRACKNNADIYHEAAQEEQVEVEYGAVGAAVVY